MFFINDGFCINCFEDSGRRRNVSENSLFPTTIELKDPPPKDHVDPESRFALPSKDVSLRKLTEEDLQHSPFPLTSLKKVKSK